MKNIIKACTIFLIPVLGAFGCKKDSAPVENARIAVSSAYLHAAAMEFLPKERMVCLSAQGMCPGHWDISPQTLENMTHCRILLRFDFQNGMDDSLERFRERGLSVQPVHAGEGLALPQTYLDVCRQVGKSLQPNGMDESVRQIEQRLSVLEHTLQIKLKQQGITGAAVLCSHHQAAFARWLGLDVLAEFGGGEDATPVEIQNCLEAAKNQDVRFIIANRAQGADLADSLAEKLRAKVIVFDNFPEQAQTPAAFDRMLEKNVAALLENASP